jgi:hypothetical protein
MVTTRPGRSRRPATTRALERGDAVDAGLAGGVGQWMPFRRLLVDGEQRWRGTPTGGEVGLLQEARRGSFGRRGVATSGGGARTLQVDAKRTPSGRGRGRPSAARGALPTAAQGILRAAARESFGRRKVGARAAALWMPWPAARRCGVSPAGGAEEWGLGFWACAGEWGKWLVSFSFHRASLFGLFSLYRSW